MNQRESRRHRNMDNRAGRFFGGGVLIVIGAVLLAKQVGIDFPDWLFSWKTFLIALGIFLGARHSFKGFGWMVPLTIGTVFLVEDLVPGSSFKEYIWPALIILFGVFMIFRPRRKHDDWGWERKTSSDDFVDSTSIFGGSKRTIITKEFKGADITNMFGGTELNLTQADFHGTVVLDVTQMFGGTKLIVPAHWNIKSDVVCIFGGIDDKRPQATETPDSGKVLRLDGVCIFGGIEIKSY